MADGQEQNKSCCQSKAVESSCLEGKHRDGNSSSEPAGDKSGSSQRGQLSMLMSGVLPEVPGLSMLIMER